MDVQPTLVREPIGVPSALRKRVGVRLVALLLGLSATAWMILVFRPSGLALPAVCGAAAAGSTGSSLDLALALNPPSALAGGWALMVAAMMGPLLTEPLRSIHDRYAGLRRARATALFVIGYSACWMSSGILFLALVVGLRLAIADPTGPLAAAISVAFFWQVSPAKRRCLAGCRAAPSRHRAALEAGFAHGSWCVGTCWALMLAALLVPRGHVAAMAIAALFVFVERLDWRAALRRCMPRPTGLHRLALMRLGTRREGGIQA